MHAFGRRPALLKAADAPRQLRADDDKRFAPRRGGRMPAVVLFDGAMESYPFVIVDISTTGARLEWRKGGANPFISKWDDVERIWLVVRTDRVMYDCRIVRRSDTEIGVKFVAAPKAMTRASRPTR
jgi:hypothetical protein